MSHPSSFAKRETLSPGLLFSNGDRTPAFELKFLLCEARAHEVERWAATHFVPDPHADPDLVTAYRVTSLYLDTPGLDVFHRFPPHHRRKLRLRGYGSWATVFLEQKTRHGDRVRKRRTPILQSELHRFRDAAHRRRLATDGRAEPLPNRYPQRDMSEANGEDWPGDWFHHRLLERGLRPTFQIGCARSAFLGAGPEGPMRLTLDRHIRGVPNEEWRRKAAYVCWTDRSCWNSNTATPCRPRSSACWSALHCTLVPCRSTGWPCARGIRTATVGR